MLLKVLLKVLFRCCLLSVFHYYCLFTNCCIFFLKHVNLQTVMGVLLISLYAHVFSSPPSHLLPVFPIYTVLASIYAGTFQHNDNFYKNYSTIDSVS